MIVLYGTYLEYGQCKNAYDNSHIIASNHVNCVLLAVLNLLTFLN